MVERDGGVRVEVTVNTKVGNVAMPLVRKHVDLAAHVNTDQHRVYNEIQRFVYSHNTVNYANKDCVRGNAHTNTIEGSLGQMKRSINGTYHIVSPKYLQL